MTKKMLIDASHPEETRVVVVDHSRVEELDFESQAKRQLRGNVYLARVTRVEPSLQAAFVEFGGNRHGFLAFSEIHPDYYQIPFEDRQKLIEEEEEVLEDDDDDDEEASAAVADADIDDDDDEDDFDPLTPAATTFRTAENRKVKDLDDPTAMASKNFKAAEKEFEEAEARAKAKAERIKAANKKKPAKINADDIDDDDDDDDDDSDDEEKEIAQEKKKMDRKRQQRSSRRRYKIQEVIKRGQIMLVQAVKEERGNKGAALTTYMSLAGRYCVLMPNTPRGGGISRKISNGSDRKHLKAIMSDLEVPKGMGVIVRTAGAKRTKAEIERDYEYLARLWDTIRDNTMNSVAPALIHQEGDLVKRSLRDLYNKDIEEVLVQGETAYEEARNFIEMLMPSHTKNIKLYDDEIPLFLRYQVDKQIEASLDPVAQLPSGGYLVIHPTEALVSVDVNSGRSTKERNVERTALKTNLEAADEVARQMRLRDLAGLVVIDFIDMDENRNNRAVEKRMKDALSRDRARVQMGRISQFGLMEISRQRRRRSLLEGSSSSCENCGGVGRKRSVESSALLAIRAVEEEGVRGLAKRIRLKVSPNVALYLFNEKRDLLQHVDAEFNVFTELVSDDSLHRPHFEIERVELRDGAKDKLEPIEKAAKAEMKKRPARPKKQAQNNNRDDDDNEEQNGEGGGNNKRRRNRGGKKRRGRNDNQSSDGESAETVAADSDANEAASPESTDENGEPRKRRRRRGRRGGRGKRNDESNATAQDNNADKGQDKPKSEDSSDASDEGKSDKPKTGRRRKSPAKAAASDDAPKTEPDSGDVKPDEKTAAKPRKRTRKPAAKAGDDSPAEEKPKSKPKSKAKTEAKDDQAESKTEKPAPKRTRRKAPAKPKDTPEADGKADTRKADKPKRVRRAAPKPAAKAEAPASAEPAPKADPTPKPKPKTETAADKKAAKKAEKKGWWSKRNPFS